MPKLLTFISEIKDMYQNLSLDRNGVEGFSAALAEQSLPRARTKLLFEKLYGTKLSRWAEERFDISNSIP